MTRFEKDRLASGGARETRRGTGFLRSEDGSFIIFGLMMFVLMLIVAGMSVDFMRFETQRTRLQSTLDRAILAASSMDQTLDPEEVVLDYFDKAGLGQFIDASMIDVYENDTLIDGSYSGPTDGSLVSRRVEASASLNMTTTFLRWSGIDSLAAPASGAAEESASQTEISLVLDTSGSMSWSSSSGNSKIYDLRNAAKQFINIVLCDPAYPNRTSPCVVESGKVSVSIVPYSEQVLVGESLLSSFNPTDEHTDSSCVTFDANDFADTSITPTQTLNRTGHFDPWSSGDTARDSRRTCRMNSWREITAVNGDAATLRDAIDDLGASGNTSIDVGMKWGTAFLDPAAQPVVEDLIAAGKTDEDYDGRPLDWDVSRIAKVIVLMTDGVNTSQHYLYDGYRAGNSPVWRFQCDSNDPCDGDGYDYVYSIYDADTDRYYWDEYRTWEDHPYGAGSHEECSRTWVRTSRYSGYYQTTCEEVVESADADTAVQLTFPEVWKVKSWNWWDDFSWLGDAGDSWGNSTKNTRLDYICDAAKAEGITVYTIGFEVTSSSATVMNACASSDAHYYDADGLDLADAFASIAREISKLRLTN